MKKYIQPILILFISFVFIQSLFFKFTDAAETMHIFQTLNEWALTLGLPALFLPPLIPGIFNQYVIGFAELVTSIFLLFGLFAKKPCMLFLGAFGAVCIMAGAISFHLFTPLGIEVQGDGGALFIMACLIFLSATYLLVKNAGSLKPCCEKEICTKLGNDK